MKKLLLTLLPVLALALSGTAQDTLFFEDFDGGIPDDWEIGPGDPEGAVWQWSPDGTASSIMFEGETVEAGFYGERPPIGSASAANGAAQFNSDAYDSGGVNPGEGPIPAPHVASLTSPSIDCSDQDVVLLKFNQYFRNFFSNTTVGISNDGGMSFNDISLNNFVRLNTGIPSTDVEVLDISEFAANQPDVQLRFTFDGDYYFWILDDILVTTPPAGNEVAIPDYFFFSAIDLQRPVDAPIDTFEFETSVSNFGMDSVENLVLRSRIIQLLEGDNVTLYDDSTVVENFPAMTTDTLLLDNVWVPDEPLPVGDYQVVYDVYPQDRNDFTGGNNQDFQSFNITENLFAKEDIIPFSTQPASFDDYEIGPFYSVGPGPAEDSLIATSMTTAASVNAPDSLDFRQLTVLLYEVNEGIAEDLSNFPADMKDGPEAGATIVGFNTLEFPEGSGTFEEVTVDILPFDITQDVVHLKANRQYFVTCSYVDQNSILFQGFNDYVDYFGTAAYLTWLPEAGENGEWVLNLFGTDDGVPTIRLNTEIRTVSQDNVPLPEGSLTVFPNPIQSGENLSLGVELEQPEEAMVLITDVDGRIVRRQDFDSLHKETVTIRTAKLPAGAYFVRLSTNSGTKTKQFTVVK